jgi:phosphoadenosine phosphosulfate reductase
MMESCFKDGTKRYLHAIIDWTNDDVWEYVQLRGIKTCKLYEEPGRTRIGCIMCPMAGGKRQRQDGDRWPNIKRAYLGAFTKMIAARVRDGLPTEWKTAEEAMEWWIQETNKKRPDDENTTIQLFE